MYHSTGDGTWTSLNGTFNSDERLAVWGASKNDVYAGGFANDSLFHSSALGTWTQIMVSGSRSISHIWGSSASDVFVADTKNGIFHGSGATFALENSSPNVFGFGGRPGEIYAVGQGGFLQSTGHGDWFLRSVTNSTLAAVWASTSSSDIFMVGTGGLILHGK
jgi:hypothetical protein